MLIPLPPPPAPLLRKRPHPEDTLPVRVSRTSAACRLPHRLQEAIIVAPPEEMSVPTPKRATPGMGFLDDDGMISTLARTSATAAPGNVVPLPARGTPTAADGTLDVKQRVPRLKLDLGSFYVPKEGKNPRGEDAHFVNKPLNAFGVADGVGGWSKRGVDAGEFARQLMSSCEAELEAAACCSTTWTSLPEGVLERAVARTTARGTSTACIAVVDGQLLRAVNLGDSGFLVVRGDKVVYHSAPQKGSLNRPYQVGGVDRGDPPESASRIAVPIEPGDIIVAGTDGLFDNLFDAEILGVLAGAKADGHGTPEEMARAVAWAAVEAYVVGEETPFSVACRGAKVSCNGGGKLDDVTVVVASVW